MKKSEPNRNYDSANRTTLEESTPILVRTFLEANNGDIERTIQKLAPFLAPVTPPGGKTVQDYVHEAATTPNLEKQ